MKTWVFDRTDFEGNPHYNFHFNDLCEYLGLTNDRKAEDIDSITVYDEDDLIIIRPVRSSSDWRLLHSGRLMRLKQKKPQKSMKN